MSDRKPEVDLSHLEIGIHNLVAYEGGAWQIIARRPGEDEDLRCGWMGSMDDRSRRGYYTLQHTYGPNTTGRQVVKDVDPNDFGRLNEMEIIAYAAL